MFEFIAKQLCRLGICIQRDYMVSDDWTGSECRHCPKRWLD